MTRQRNEVQDAEEWKCLIPILERTAQQHEQLKADITALVNTSFKTNKIEMPVPQHQGQQQVCLFDNSKTLSIFAEYVWVQIFTDEREEFLQCDEGTAATRFVQRVQESILTSETTQEIFRNLFKDLKCKYEEQKHIDNTSIAIQTFIGRTTEDAAASSDKKNRTSNFNNNNIENNNNGVTGEDAAPEKLPDTKNDNVKNIPPPVSSSSPPDDFRLSELKKFLRLEPFATDPDNSSSRIEVKLPGDVDDFATAIKDSYWLVYSAEKKPHNLAQPADSELQQWETVYNVIGTAIIRYFDLNNKGEAIDLRNAFASWSSGFSSGLTMWSRFNVLNFYVLRNNEILLRLLGSSNQHDVLYVARQRFEKSMDPSTGPNRAALREFYGTRSVVVMSELLSKYTAERFVTPTSEKLLQFRSFTEGVPTPESNKVNIIGGWSGVGKSSAATLPLFTAAAPPSCLASQASHAATGTTQVPRQPPPICVVVTASDIFATREHSSSMQDSETATKRQAATYEGFSKLEGTARDERAACLLVSGILAAFSLREPEQLTKERVQGSDLCTNYKDFFTDEVQQLLRGKINKDLSDSNEFRLVFDEAGSCSQFVRAFCSIGEKFRKFLSDIFRVKIEKIFLYVVGSGTEVIESAPDGAGTDRNSYALFTVQPNQFFAQLLSDRMSAVGRLPSADNQAPDLYTRLFNELFVKKADTIEARVSTHDARRFVHIVSDNARCAALGMRLIVDFVSVHSSFDFMMSRLSTWSVDIAASFIRLNGLSSSRHPFVDIGNALRIVMSRTHRDLSPSEIYLYMIRYGILTDTKRANHFVTSQGPRYRIAQSFVTMFLLRMNLDLSNEFLSADASFEYLVANHHALCLVLRPEITATSPLSWKLFQGVNISPNANVDTVALGQKLTDGVTKKESDDIHEEINNTTTNTQHPLLSSNNISLRRKLQLEVDEWKKTVRNGGAVVIIGSPQTPNADAFVLTDGKLFLMQYKYYQPNNSLSENQVGDEFDKMLTSPQNVFARTLLRECCAVRSCDGDIDKVEVIASIVVLYRNSLNAFVAGRLKQGEQFIETDGRFEKGAFADGNRNHTWSVAAAGANQITNAEKFNYKKRFICVFDTIAFQNNRITNDANATNSVLLDFASDGTNSELYPLLTSPLDVAHLAKSETILTVLKRTRQVVEASA